MCPTSTDRIGNRQENTVEYTEKTKAGMGDANKLLETTIEDRKDLELRIKEIQDLLDPVNKDIDILTTQVEKAKEAYERAVAKAAEQEHAQTETPQGETPKGADKYMAWLCTLKGNATTAEGHEKLPEIQKAWQAYAEGKDLENLKPIAWATSIVTATVEKHEEPTPSTIPTTTPPDAQPTTPTTPMAVDPPEEKGEDEDEADDNTPAIQDEGNGCLVEDKTHLALRRGGAPPAEVKAGDDETVVKAPPAKVQVIRS